MKPEKQKEMAETETTHNLFLRPKDVNNKIRKTIYYDFLKTLKATLILGKFFEKIDYVIDYELCIDI